MPLVSGVAFGQIQYKNSEFFIKKSKIKNDNSSLESEILTLNNALKSAKSQLETLRQNSLNKFGKENSSIFDVHLMMLEDNDFLDAIRGNIKDQLESASYSVFKIAKQFEKNFLSLNDEYMRLRAADIIDVAKRISECILKKDTTENSDKNDIGINDGEGIILVADDFTPSDIMSIDETKITGIIAIHGNQNSHMAILAKARGIPTIVDVKAKFRQAYNGEKAVLDGINGILHINPDFSTYSQLQQKKDIFAHQNELLELLKDKESVTKDGQKIKLFANIMSLNELDSLPKNIAGIGLFRTEFIFLDKSEPPNESQQFEMYKKIVEKMGKRPVIFRTADFGADKKPSFINFPAEENPAMGYRGIRVSFDYLELFKAQIKAIFRASAFGNVAIMFPMITTVDEVQKIKKIVKKIKKEFDDTNIPYDKNIQIGLMIETPAAVMISDMLAKHVDFFSIGTNDLTQYTLALDRQNNKVNKFFNSKHPAIMKMIQTVVENAHKFGIWAGICGEMASDLTLTQEFLKMQIDELSMPQIFILGVKKVILETDMTNILKSENSKTTKKITKLSKG